jgi:hypothetical protein
VYNTYNNSIVLAVVWEPTRRLVNRYLYHTHVLLTLTDKEVFFIVIVISVGQRDEMSSCSSYIYLPCDACSQVSSIAVVVYLPSSPRRLFREKWQCRRSRCNISTIASRRHNVVVSIPLYHNNRYRHYNYIVNIKVTKWRLFAASASYVTRPIGCSGLNVITKCAKSRKTFSPVRCCHVPYFRSCRMPPSSFYSSNLRTEDKIISLIKIP